MHQPDPAPDLLSSALAYTRRGWRVLPVIAGDKRPALARWPELATTDPRQVADWWIDDPTRNIGIATGEGSGFFVLDIDPKNGGDEALSSLEQVNGGLPTTYTVRTGSGGLHFYFAMPDFDVTNSPGQLRGTGIDVRGEGGQVVAPPSVTPAGVYTVESSAPVAPAPGWLLDLIRPRPLALVGGTDVAPRIGDFDRLLDYTERAILAATETVAAARGGSRNQTLNDQVLALAGIAAHEAMLVDKAKLYETMHLACQTNGYLADDGIRPFAATFESAWKAGLLRPRHVWPPADHRPGDPGPTALPTVLVSQRKHNELTDEIVGHLAAANETNPRLFLHGTELVQIVGPPARTAALDASLLTYEADVAMHFERSLPKGGTAVANAPTKVVETILVLPRRPFPVLTRIAHAPFFSATGRYVSTPGYDEESRTFYTPSLDLSVLPVPPDPTADQVAAAVTYIRTEMLADFPFTGEAEVAGAFALMLLPFVRDVIDGATPLHNIEAPTPGSGKGKLLRCLLLPGVGRHYDTVNAPSGEEEWQKSLLSYLRKTPQALVLDNVNVKLSSGSLCSVLTEPEVSARVLGVSNSVTVPIRSVFAMTANNPKFSDEVARRCVRIRLDSGVEHPEDRGGFRHDDVVAWCAAHRAELVAACCVMVQGWVRAGMPEQVPAKPFGSFERWHAVMGGLLDFLGVPGLLGNKADFLAAGDDEADAWAQLVEMMKHDLLREWTSAELATEVTERGIAIDLGHRDNKPLMMGRQLGRQRDRWHGGYTIERRMLGGKALWRLVGRPSL